MSFGTYTCAKCNGTFEKGAPDEVANAESKLLFDVDNASSRIGDDMAIICDNCFHDFMEFYSE